MAGENDNIPSRVRAGAEHAEQIVRTLNDQPAPSAAAPDRVATQQQAQDQTQTGTPATLEQQLRTLQGKYDAEVPRLAKECAKLRNQVSALLEENASLKTELQNAPKKVDTQQRPAEEKKLNPESFGNYGEEFVDLARRFNMLEEENQKLRTAAAAPAKPLERRPTEADKIAADNFAAFYAKVASAVPDLEALNNDPQLLKWLDDTIDAETGFRMRDIMNRAQQSYNHEAATKLFNKFKQQILVPPPDTGQRIQPPIAPATTQVSGQLPANPQLSGRIWTRADINQFYRDVRDRKYLGRENDQAAMEADIFKAQTEGRIRG